MPYSGVTFDKMINANGMSHSETNGQFDGGAGSWLSKEGHAAYTQAIDELQAIAQEGKDEASVVVDAQTGKRLDAKTGDPNSVGYDPQKSAGSKTVVALHAHTDEAPNSGDDWDVFLLNPEVKRLVAVTPTHLHILEKPDAWKPQDHKLPVKQGDAHPTITPLALFFAYAKNLKRRHQIADTMNWEDMAEKTRNAIFAETNEFLKTRFGVIVRQVKL
ncbi:MAG: hypothetical protein M3347_13180 [Armatimonadota bacterium]|nr:hypothetical protein [Armatimonadota bacterium]